MTKRKNRDAAESDMDDFVHQPNLDQEEHDKWLASLSRDQIDDLAKRAAAMFREKEKQKLASDEGG
jgi:hypothetical protein